MAERQGATPSEGAEPNANILPAKVPEKPHGTGDLPSGASTAAIDAAQAPHPLPPVELLTSNDDFAPFMAQDVSPELRNLAMKKLFADPHFNIMDGLDVYIDDYGKPDPLPAEWLRRMTQSQLLGLFRDETAKSEVPDTAVPSTATPDGPAAISPALPCAAADSEAGPVPADPAASDRTPS